MYLRPGSACLSSFALKLYIGFIVVLLTQICFIVLIGMKRYFAFLLIFFLFLPAFSQEEEDEEDDDQEENKVDSALIAIGSITFLKGRVDIIHLHHRKRKLATAGMAVYANDAIRTGSRSEVLIILLDSSRIQIGALSVINIKLLSPKVNTQKKSQLPISVRMLSGKIRINVPSNYYSNKRRFFLKTPTMVAGVRGTDFACIATMYDARLVVYRGVVQVGNRSQKYHKSYFLKERQHIRVRYQSEPDAPRFVNSLMLSNYLDRFIITKKHKIKKRIREPETFVDRFLRNRH